MVWVLVIVSLSSIAILNQAAARPESRINEGSSQYSPLLGRGASDGGQASFQSEVRDTSLRVTFLVNAALMGYVIFGCIFVPLAWLLLFRQPRSRVSADGVRGKSIG
jgi:hypothetical protein